MVNCFQGNPEQILGNMLSNTLETALIIVLGRLLSRKLGTILGKTRSNTLGTIIGNTICNTPRTNLTIEIILTIVIFFT